MGRHRDWTTEVIRLPWDEQVLLPVNQNSSDTQSAELPANAEQTEPADPAPEVEGDRAVPGVAREVVQPAAEIPPAGTEESVEVTPTTDTPATDAEQSAAEATTTDQPPTETAEAEQPAAESTDA